MPTERLWTDRQLKGMTDTVVYMRKIRTAATADGSSVSSRTGRLMSILRISNPESVNTAKSREVILFDAERLGATAGNFFAARLSDTSSGNLELEEWQDTLSDVRKQYKKYKESTHTKYTKTETLEVVRKTMPYRFRLLSIDPDYMLRWDLTLNNNLGAENADQLINNDIGVISPLSTDYIMSCTYSSYLQKTQDRTFLTKPAALSSDLRLVVLPKDKEGREVFELVPEIGIYIDTTVTGNTGRLLFQAVKEAYPNQRVLEPRATKTDFKQSNKMQDFWKKAQELRPRLN